MGRYMPGSQSRSIMAEKEQIARELLGRGLSTAQVATQLRCSRVWVRKVRSAIDVAAVA